MLVFLLSHLVSESNNACVYERIGRVLVGVRLL